jgi:hypothetical protein
VVVVDNRVVGVDDRVQQMADEVKRLSSPNGSLLSIVESYPSLQVTNYGRTFTDGSPHRTPRRTTTSHVALVTRKLQPGFFKAASFGNGNQQDRFFGSTENVCSVLFSSRLL